MGFFSNQFQYTNFHDLNLDWLLESIKQYEEIFKDIKEEWEKLWDAYYKLPTLIYSFKTELENDIVKLEVEIKQIKYQLENMRFATKEELAEQKAYLLEVIEQNVLTLKTDISLIYRLIDVKQISMREYVDQKDKELLNLINQIKCKTQGNIISPFTNKEETVQEFAEEAYKHMHHLPLTAWEYRSLYLTADQYDRKKLTAWQYDAMGRFWLGPYPWRKDRKCLQLTAQEYQNLLLTADQYSTANLTAWEYDNRAMWYFGPYPFKADLTDGTIISTKIGG